MASPPLYITTPPLADVMRGEGPMVRKFFEERCRITKESMGGRSGELLSLRPWQVNLNAMIYARREDGRRRHRRALIGLPRKNGKSAIGSGHGLYGLLWSGDGAEVYCLSPETPILCIDLQWRPVGELAAGDLTVGFDEEPSAGCVRKFRPAVVESTERISQPSYEVTLSDGRTITASSLHKWVTRPYATSNLQRWEKTEDLKPGARIHDLGAPWQLDNSREAGYLAGLLDGEACLVGAGSNGGTYRRGAVLNFAQNTGTVLDRFERGMEDRGFDLKRNDSKKCIQSNVTGTREVLRALGTLAPSRLLDKVPHWIDGIATNRLSCVEVVSVRYLGIREVVSIGTSTKTLLANGLFSHNSCAADKDQARIVFGVAKRMVEMDPALSKIIKPYRDVLEVPETGSIYRALSSEAFTKEGLNPSTILFDELHAQPNDELYDVMSNATGARANPLMIAITTAGVKTDSTGNESICYRLFKYGQDIAAGVEDDPSFFMAWWGAELGANAADIEVWKAANPGYGDLIDPEDLEANFKQATAKGTINDFKTKRLNMWVDSSRAWLPDGWWNRCATLDEWVEPARGVVLGFDGSRNGDSTALVAITVEHEPKIKVLGLWDRPEGLLEWKVPRAEVRDAFRKAFAEMNVVEVAYDEYLWQDAIDELSEELKRRDGGLAFVAFPQTSGRMAPATERFYGLVQSQNIRHDGDPRLSRHLSHAQIKTDERGSRLVKDARNSPRKIDLAVASVMACDRAGYWLTQDAPGTFKGVAIKDIRFCW